MPQIVNPSVASDPSTITERYDVLVASGKIERDPAQEEVVAALDALAHRLKDIKQTCFGLTRLGQCGWTLVSCHNPRIDRRSSRQLTTGYGRRAHWG